MSETSGIPKAHTLLIVDDNPSVRDALRYIVERRGYFAVTAASGAEAIALSAQQVFDGAMIDVNMPGMNGLALCRTLLAQSKEAGRHLAVWMITGAWTAELARLSVDAGALMLLAKPFDHAELYQQFDQQFGGPTPPEPGATPPAASS